MFKPRFTTVAAFWTAALLFAGCSKRGAKDASDSGGDSPENGSRVIATRPVATPAGLPGGSSSGQSTQAAERDSPSAAQLERDYTKTSDANDRIEIIYQLADIGDAGALRALGRLFLAETNPELKSEIISAVDDVDGLVEARLAIYAIALRPNQPDDVRQAAVDALENLEDARAIPTWRTLLNDRDAGIRDTAKAQIEALQATGR